MKQKHTGYPKTGFSINESFVATKLIAPCMISESPIIKDSNMPEEPFDIEITDKDNIKDLNEIWSKRFQNSGIKVKLSYLNRFIKHR